MAKGAVMKILHNVQLEYPDELRDEIFKAIGKIDHIEFYGQEVLVAPFVQSPYYGTTKNLLRGDKEQNEDKWQSKSFVVLKLGTGVEAACKKLGTPNPIVGQWYFGDVKEHFQLSVRGVGGKSEIDERSGNPTRPWGGSNTGGWPCRLVLVGDIRGRTTRPQDIM